MQYNLKHISIPYYLNTLFMSKSIEIIYLTILTFKEDHNLQH